MAEPKAYLGNDPYIFISYAHRNKDVVYPFIEALQEYYNVWFDDGIRYGREWEKEICSRIKNCTVFVYMITEESLASENCKDEIYMARDLGKSFLNVLVKKETKLPDEFTFRYGRFQMCNLYAFPGCAAAVLDLANKFEELGKTEKAGLREIKEAARKKAEEEARKKAEEAERQRREAAEARQKRAAGESRKQEGDPRKRIEDGAYKRCKTLTSITIPDDVTSIGHEAFCGCTSLTSITIPASVTSIGWGALCSCTSLESITVAAGNPVYHSAGNCLIETASKTLIAGCKNSVIPNDGSVTSIKDAALRGCTSLERITIPDSVTSIGDHAFDGCCKLKYNFYEKAKYLGNTNNPYVALIRATNTSAFSYTIHPNTKFICSDAFDGCDFLAKITIPNGVTSIGSGAFSGCFRLWSITIPRSMTSIESLAFPSNASLIISYQGKKEEWEKIKKSWNWDKSKEASKYTIHCTDGDIEKE